MNYLRFLRMSRGLSQAGLCRMLGLNRPVYCQIENGVYAKPSSKMLRRLQAFFGREWTFERFMAIVPEKQVVNL